VFRSDDRLPGSGKSTIANLFERKLVAMGRQTMLFDGDNLRQGLNADLGFDAAARSENVRWVGEVAKPSKRPIASSNWCLSARGEARNVRRAKKRGYSPRSALGSLC